MPHSGQPHGIGESQTRPAGIQNLNGGRTFPKRGRLGSGSYFPNPDQGSSDQIRGNPFGPNTSALARETSIGATRLFGTRSNAGNGTMPIDSRLTLGADSVHPNAGFHRMALQNVVQPMTIDGASKLFQTPFINNKSPEFIQSTVLQPHSRNRLLNNKAIRAHHTASGASRFMPVDTAFARVHPPQKPRPANPPQTNVLRTQFENDGLPRPGHVSSFVSRQQLWYDPNNSFQKGIVNPIAGGVGKGRWHTVKRGAAG